MWDEMTDTPNYKFVIDKDTVIQLILLNNVFIPTGTSVSLIHAVRDYASKPGKVLDLGAGSGAVGLSLYQCGLVEPPLYASDFSEQAVECMKRNAVLHQLPIVSMKGSLFEPWEDEKFDYIVNDISGIAEEVAELSPWYNNIPCQSGQDGTLLVNEALRKATTYLNSEGLFFFPVISLSNEDKILTVAHAHFPQVKRLNHREWPLPNEMYKNLSVLHRLRDEGQIQFKEKFGMVLYFTDVYVAYHD